jgi:hypothetical protein
LMITLKVLSSGWMITLISYSPFHLENFLVGWCISKDDIISLCDNLDVVIWLDDNISVIICLDDNIFPIWTKFFPTLSVIIRLDGNIYVIFWLDDNILLFLWCFHLAW